MTLLGPVTVHAATYKQALEDYSDQKYSKSYKKAMDLAREKRGSRRAKALVLAAAAVLELDREKKARVLFKKALDEDPDLELPEVVRSRRAQRFFDDVRDGRNPTRSSTVTKTENVPNAFDRFETYLPFGLNQLVQEKYFLGLALGGAQAFGLFYAYTKDQEANKAEADLEAVRIRAIQSGDDINPVFTDFVSKSQAFAKRSRQTSQLSLALAAAAYGASVLEAGLRPPARSRFAATDPSALRLFAVEYKSRQFQLELLNPLLSHGLQISLQF
ncbi:hypothetical protein [Oligoflexus tunisiensis]|uniref:hypothetical protein n=1 Tax=Oligoflexus tunisiensis TaxID=708132 RepID=UPI001C404F3F|nr:hypothetical protein [Oligoflexus tunisiensis]